MSEFYVFRVFDELPKAKEFECFLFFHHIECRIEQQASNQIVFQIQKADENKISTLLQDPKSGYELLNTSHQELLSITQQSDKTHQENYQLAIDLLKIRIKTIHAIQCKELEEERLKEEYKPAVLSYVMYWFILISTLLGGVGVLLAILVVTNKRKLSNGQRIHLYSKEDRVVMKWVLIIFGLLSICFIGYLFISVIVDKH